ncbi:MAG: MCE family protein [Actinomycetota bacterium]|nr:MCE family protein [Actinomycetota bacterium]
MKKLLAAVAFALLLAACSGGGDTISASAKFGDVGDLAKDAPVMMADIVVGKVTDIRLSGHEALVAVELEASAEVPEDVQIRVRRTSVLGERILDLVPAEDVDDDSPLLADGDEITNTETRSDLEDLVAEGTDVLASISASELAVMIEEGAQGFGGQGLELRRMLDNFNEIITGYAGRSKQITSLIRSLDRFNATIASRAGADEEAILNSEKNFRMLAEESDRLEQAIISLGRLARGGRSILDAHADEMERFFEHTRSIFGVLAENQGDIAGFLANAPGHNENTQRVEYIEFNQVVQDFVFCGMNDNPNDPARTCDKGGS